MKVSKYVGEDDPERKMALVYPFLSPKDEETDDDMFIEADMRGLYVNEIGEWLSIPEAEKLNAALKAAIDYSKKLNRKAKAK
jgi:hypothetical protein